MVTKRMAIYINGIFRPGIFMFPALKQNIGGEKCKDDRDVKTVATRHGLISTENAKRCPTIR